MGFSTFSTMFSTVKRCKPYTRRNPGLRVLVAFGPKRGRLAFYKKESRSFFFAFCSFGPPALRFFSNLECCGPKFSTPAVSAALPVEKPGKSRVFHTSATRQKNAPYLVFSCPLCYNLNRRIRTFFQIRWDQK